MSWEAESLTCTFFFFGQLLIEKVVEFKQTRDSNIIEALGVKDALYLLARAFRSDLF